MRICIALILALPLLSQTQTAQTSPIPELQDRTDRSSDGVIVATPDEVLYYLTISDDLRIDNSQPPPAATRPTLFSSSSAPRTNAISATTSAGTSRVQPACTGLTRFTLPRRTLHFSCCSPTTPQLRQSSRLWEWTAFLCSTAAASRQPCILYRGSTVGLTSPSIVSTPAPVPPPNSTPCSPISTASQIVM